MDPQARFEESMHKLREREYRLTPQRVRGRHQVRHPAGVDYTGGLDDAPHGADLLERFPVVGVLAPSADSP